MKGLLLLKHWHLFILIVVLSAFSVPGNVTSIPRIVALFTFLGWLSAISIYGNTKILAYGLKPLNIKFFKFNSFILISSFLVLPFLAVPRYEETGLSDLPLIFLACYVAFAIFHSFWFAGKTMSILTNRGRGGDYLGKFLLLFFFPVGVWFIQPQLNRLFSSEVNTL